MVAVCRLWGAYPGVEKVHAAPQLSKNSVMILKIRRANLFEETCFWLHQHADETYYDYSHIMPGTGLAIGHASRTIHFSVLSTASRRAKFEPAGRSADCTEGAQTAGCCIDAGAQQVCSATCEHHVPYPSSARLHGYFPRRKHAVVPASFHWFPTSRLPQARNVARLFT
jgi:hypothetical protein